MKKKTSAFRPVLSDPLESRTVLSGYGGFAGLGMGMGGGYAGQGMSAEMGYGGGGGSAAGQATQAAANDFQTFETAYNLAIYNDLEAPPTPSVSGFTGDKTVAAAFSTLSTNLGTDVASLTATNPNLAGTLQTDVSTLQTTLNGLTTPANTAAVPSFQQLALQNISQTYSQVIQSISSAAPPAGTVTQASLSAIQTQINTALQTFNTSVNTAFQALFPGSGTTTPNAGAFTSAVKTAASTLSTSVSAAVTSTNSGLPSALSTSLNTTLAADVTNLQSSLTSLSVPTSTAGFGVQTFASEAASAISDGEGRLGQDLITAVQSNNAALNPAPTTLTGTSTGSSTTSTTATPASTTTTTATSKKLSEASLRLTAAENRLSARLSLETGLRGHRRMRL